MTTKFKGLCLFTVFMNNVYYCLNRAMKSKCISSSAVSYLVMCYVIATTLLSSPGTNGVQANTGTNRQVKRQLLQQQQQEDDAVMSRFERWAPSEINVDDLLDQLKFEASKTTRNMFHAGRRSRQSRDLQVEPNSSSMLPQRRLRNRVANRLTLMTSPVAAANTHVYNDKESVGHVNTIADATGNLLDAETGLSGVNTVLKRR
jgi:hypothetical protein